MVTLFNPTEMRLRFPLGSWVPSLQDRYQSEDGLVWTVAEVLEEEVVLSVSMMGIGERLESLARNLYLGTEGLGLRPLRETRSGRFWRGTLEFVEGRTPAIQGSGTLDARGETFGWRVTLNAKQGELVVNDSAPMPINPSYFSPHILWNEAIVTALVFLGVSHKRSIDNVSSRFDRDVG